MTCDEDVYLSFNIESKCSQTECRLLHENFSAMQRRRNISLDQFSIWLFRSMIEGLWYMQKTSKFILFIDTSEFFSPLIPIHVFTCLHVVKSKVDIFVVLSFDNMLQSDNILMAAQSLHWWTWCMTSGKEVISD